MLALCLASLSPRCWPRRAAPRAPRLSMADESEGRPTIEWYPGHIAKAERLMSEVLSMVDVVVELRDARAPTATTHPLLSNWVGGRGRVLVINRMDSVPEVAVTQWERSLIEQGETPIFVDAKRGAGVPALKRAILKEGARVNDRRKRRGIKPRAVRAAILGYPNVGKSALINRLVGRRKTKSENRPGVTRGFSWIRIDKDVQLLDSPGIIPAKQESLEAHQSSLSSVICPLVWQVSQSAAYRLAMCDDIGSAAYDKQGVAAALFERLVRVEGEHASFARYTWSQSLLFPKASYPYCTLLHITSSMYTCTGSTLYVIAGAFHWIKIVVRSTFSIWQMLDSLVM